MKGVIAPRVGQAGKDGMEMYGRRTNLGKDPKGDEPDRARDTRPAGRTPRQRNDTIVLAEGGVGHAGAESRDEA